MKRLFMLATMVVFSLVALAGCGGNQAAESGSSSGSGSGKIVVGLDDNYPPMGFKDENNEITGFDVDVAKEAAKRLGREVEFKAIDWDSKEAELKSKRVDVLWNGLDITEKRKENMAFSEPYMENRQIVFVRKDKADSIKSVEDLQGKVVGTQSGGTAEEYIDEHQSFKQGMKDVKKYTDYISAFMDLENGRLDAIVADEITGRYYMSKHPENLAAQEIVVGPISDFGIGFRKEDTELRAEVQKVMDEMKADGTLAKISEKWFGKDIMKK
ncbi:amino acid ABC transporter substrate-binding protein [Selenomonas ruminis]|uniref:Amino acid ABC transporter substrate-binding protein n=1 Tax=Selenomonas ruminis TaxID=2593411 RepID=A0A5D6WD24_9FIRM|nr:amino acid ABC transporter substrate-binding protein [Selenomonas sp. mPRGC5]TYZ24879.1 amino acid ABC transporter substrate-binding protein [Selenomonas sp. mPRGC5]